MNTTLTVVVAAIVILITALVVITIFGGGMTQVGGISEAASVCRTQCDASCRSTGSTPLTWSVKTLRDQQGNVMSCEERVGSATCDTSAGTCTVSGGGTEYGCSGIGGRCTNSGCNANEQIVDATCPSNLPTCCKSNS